MFFFLGLVQVLGFMHIVFNVIAASSGSGLTYVRNVAAVLCRRNDVRATFLVGPELSREFGRFANVAFEEMREPQSVARRVLWEQSALPRIVRRLETDVLVSAGNFALRRSPVPQILLSGNSLYTSTDYRRDLLQRREYGLWLDNGIRSYFAARSVGWADVTVAPSESFAQDLRQWTRDKRVVAIHHGFDREVFFGEDAPLPDTLQKVLTDTDDCLRLLFVSHFNYFRNFETMFRGLSILRAMLPGKNPKLLLTTRLRSAENPGEFHAEPAAALVRELGLSEHVVELGAIPYRQLQHLYRACDLYVSASYAETFAHPVVEAMACGVPVVASDLPVHREVAREAAVYFPRFSPEGLAKQVREVVSSAALAREMSQNGERRAHDFSWEKHVDQMVDVARNLIERRAG
jgi:glycosyltransferase involved in cell wall biosynthesis